MQETELQMGLFSFMNNLLRIDYSPIETSAVIEINATSWSTDSDQHTVDLKSTVGFH